MSQGGLVMCFYLCTSENYKSVLWHNIIGTFLIAYYRGYIIERKPAFRVHFLPYLIVSSTLVKSVSSWCANPEVSRARNESTFLFDCFFICDTVIELKELYWKLLTEMSVNHPGWWHVIWTEMFPQHFLNVFFLQYFEHHSVGAKAEISMMWK